MALANLREKRDEPGGQRRVPPQWPCGTAYRREDRVATQCEQMLDIASELFNVSGRELRSPNRSRVAVTRVRQIAMYVAHVILQLTMSEIGRCFGRDRTTVMHACHLIEDMRDDPEFDQVVAIVERTALQLILRRSDFAHE